MCLRLAPVHRNRLQSSRHDSHAYEEDHRTLFVEQDEKRNNGSEQFFVKIPLYTSLGPQLTHRSEACIDQGWCRWCRFQSIEYSSNLLGRRRSNCIQQHRSCKQKYGVSTDELDLPLHPSYVGFRLAKLCDSPTVDFRL